ncbi:hypothetical protein NGTWS1803_06160 [Mycolicibacterium cyprinidarum]|nr:hypothetical protein NGTWS1803_06160 [Mycolicibacterium sp. NGTWS1803]
MPDTPLRKQQVRFLARLGAAMSAASYPVTSVRQMLERASTNYGVANDFIALPNHVEVVGQTGSDSGSIVKAAHHDRDLRFDQMFPLARLISDAMGARVTPSDGEIRLDEVLAKERPYRAWVSVLGYAAQSVGLALLLEPTPLNLLVAGGLGVVVGLFWTAGQRVPGLVPMVPVLSAFVVTAVCVIGARKLGMDHVGLRALIPPLAMFLPGVAITLAVIELTARDVVSGSSRLIAGFVQIAQLAFGILIASQMLQTDDTQLTSVAINKIGPWAPWLGVTVYCAGVMMFLAPPRSFLPWLLLITYIGYAAQFVGDLLLGSYASGFCGGVVLTLAALVMTRRRGSPPAVTIILPGFWLLVPGSMGLIGITELFGADGDSALPATLISMVSVSLGMQSGLVLWQLIRHRTQKPGVR